MRIFFCLALMLLSVSNIYSEDFKFAVISDCYVNPENQKPLEDLQSVVSFINQSSDIDFVLVLGNITERGDKASIQAVKDELENLNTKYYVIPGYNETKSGGTGTTTFEEVFGSDRFSFDHKGFKFIGFTDSPIVKRMDGHVGIDDLFWVGQELSKAPKMPSFIATHMPLTMRDVDNWSEVTDQIRIYNVQAILNGHYGKNMKTDYDNIPGLMNRSTLRDSYDGLAAYNVYTVTDGTLTVGEQKTETGLRPLTWATYPLGSKFYSTDTKNLKRPDYSINNKYPKIKILWNMNLYKSVYSAPTSNGNRAFFGNSSGTVYAFDLNDGGEYWRYEAGSAIIGTPAASNRVVVFGTTNNTIFGLDTNTGRELWQQMTGGAVVGDVTIDGNIAYVGSSDGVMRALDVSSGNIKWEFTEAEDYIESKPFIFNDLVIFSAWDGKVYALDKRDGSLKWEWTNEDKRRRFAPGGVSPVAANGKVFFTTPNGSIHALDVSNGEPIWDTNEWNASESIGISENGMQLYVKTVQDSVVCFSTKVDEPQRIWGTSIGKSQNNLSSSRIVESGGTVFGSTKNGIIYGLDAKKGDIMWMFKTGNSYVGTVYPVGKNKCLYTTTLGTIGLLEGVKNSK